MKRHTTVWSTTIAIAIAIAVCACSQRSATAQTNSLFGSRGPASQIGTNMVGSMTGLGNTRSEPTFMGADGQSGATGQSTTASGLVPDQRFGQFGQGGNAGRNSRDFGNRNGGGNRGRGGNRNGGARSAVDRAGRNPQRARAAIRPRQRVAFSYPVRGAAVVNFELTRQLQEVAKVRTELAGVAVTIDDLGVATITGMVTTPEQRRLAELLVRLEPGVRSVRNEMTVVGG